MASFLELLPPEATGNIFFLKASRGSGQKHGISDCLILYRDKESQSRCPGWKIARVAVLKTLRSEPGMRQLYTVPVN